jgi:hypothetical protein
MYKKVMIFYQSNLYLKVGWVNTKLISNTFVKTASVL